MLNGLLTLALAADFVEEKDAAKASQQPESDPQNLDLGVGHVPDGFLVNETLGKPNKATALEKYFESYMAKSKVLKNGSCKQKVPKIPNNLFADFIENTSDELNKKFSLKCKFSKCSVVVESYGSEAKAFTKIKSHIWLDHLMANHSDELQKQDASEQEIGKSRHVKRKLSVKRLSDGASNVGKSLLQKAQKRTCTESDVPLVTCFEDGSIDPKDALEIVLLDHDYDISGEELPVAKSPVHEAESKSLCNWGEIMRRIEEDDQNGSDTLPPTVIPSPPFPGVLCPPAFEPACILEFHENGDPVESRELSSVQSSITRNSQTITEFRASRRPKLSKPVNAQRAVLECVENRVASKSNTSPGPRDALDLVNCMENSENVEKGIREIALRNIELLKQQRKKRKCCVKPSVYACEICKKSFTANTSLSTHYLSHLKVKQFKCYKCDKSFTRRHSLKYHMMIHNNASRFECTECKRLFRHPSHFKEHMRKHTGEEPYSCEFCSNKFKTRNSFKRHLKIQHQKHLTSKGIVPILNDN